MKRFVALVSSLGLVAGSITFAAAAYGAVATVQFTTVDTFTYTVPAGTTTVQVKAWGAQGRDVQQSFGLAPGGRGGYTEAFVPVTPGDVLSVVVGGVPGAGGAGYGGGGFGGSSGGGGGGGASTVRTSAGERLVVAGGGGGSGSLGNFGRPGQGGPGGNAGSVGVAGQQGQASSLYPGEVLPSGGRGATQTVPGSGGASGYTFGTTCCPGAAGSSGVGGNGGTQTSGGNGGGGGGGWFGGGGGAGGMNVAFGGGGGGGGSSFVPVGNGIVYLDGVRSGNGAVHITPVPGAAGDIVPVAGDKQVFLSWAPSANAQLVDGYRVTSSAGHSIDVGGTPLGTSAVLTGLTNGTTYTFTVTPLASGVLGVAASVSATPVERTPPPVAPGSPTDATATLAGTAATLSWVAPSADNGSPVLAYAVTPVRDGVPQTTITFNSTATTQVVGLLDPGSTYTFDVAAVNAGGPGATTPTNAVTPALPPAAPGSPTDATATLAGTAATLSWVAPSADNGSPVLAYAVTPVRDGVPQTTITFSSTATSQVVGALNIGATYAFDVAAVNAGGTGDVARTNAVTPVPVITPPGAPSTVRASERSSTSATVTWTAPASNGGSPLTGYVVNVVADGLVSRTVNVAGGQRSVTITGMRANTTFVFLVQAVNAVGTGPNSLPSNDIGPGNNQGRGK